MEREYRINEKWENKKCLICKKQPKRVSYFDKLWVFFCLTDECKNIAFSEVREKAAVRWFVKNMTKKDHEEDRKRKKEEMEWQEKLKKSGFYDDNCRCKGMCMCHHF